MAHEIFISYAEEDRGIAEAICSALEGGGVGCWMAPRDIVAGTSWQKAIVDAIPRSKLFVLVLSPHAVASPHVQTELRRAFEVVPILPYRVAEVPLDNEFGYMIGGFHFLDAVGDPLGEGLERLARDVRRHLGRPIEPESKTSGASKPPTAVKVVLAYKRNAQPDEQLSAFLERELAGHGYEIFVDRHLKVGLDWPREIEHRIRRADVVIPLLSAASAQSEMVTWEIQTAHDEALRRDGKPRLLPVRVHFEDPLPPESAAILDRLQYFLWNGPFDNPRLLDDLIDAFRGPRPIHPPRPIPVGGLPLDSPSYIRRSTDDEFHSALAQGESIVLIRGARQMGKTSLLARGLRRVEEGGARVAFTDFQRLNKSELQSPEALYRAIGAALADELDLDVLPEDIWTTRRAANVNFEHYVRNQVLERVDAPVVWALDEVDRLFFCDFGSEVFALFRSWHNKRTGLGKHSGLWRRLTLAIAYATEAHLFIADLDQSPFNVGRTVTLEDFAPEQVADLNARYDSPLRDAAERKAFTDIVGGHPFLVNRGLHAMAQDRLDLAAFAAQAGRDEGLFGDHLRRILVLLAKDPELSGDLRKALGGKPNIPAGSFYRLRAAGVLAGESPPEVRPRCPLYATFLKRHLGIK